ncbi:hypothetical protein TWF506_007350 [Arthrobotrys conoides]|uniref:Uncharacterized protein n=1 Tax=Arthrobotrys conoides TaxID=74498 RepID=A0AAN8RXY4_9PEZI
MAPPPEHRQVKVRFLDNSSEVDNPELAPSITVTDTGPKHLPYKSHMPCMIRVVPRRSDGFTKCMRAIVHGFRAVDITNCAGTAAFMPGYREVSRAIDGIERAMRATGITRDQLWIQLSLPSFGLTDKLPTVEASDPALAKEIDLSPFRHAYQERLKTFMSKLHLNRLAGINQPEGIDIKSHTYIDCLFINLKAIPDHHLSRVYRIIAEIFSGHSQIRHIGLLCPRKTQLEIIWGLFQGSETDDKVSMARPTVVRSGFVKDPIFDPDPDVPRQGYDYEVRTFCQKWKIPYQAMGLYSFEGVENWKPLIRNLRGDFRKCARELEVPEVTLMYTLFILLKNTAVLHHEDPAHENIDVDSAVLKDVTRLLRPKTIQSNPSFRLLARRFRARLEAPFPEDLSGAKRRPTGAHSEVWRRIFPNGKYGNASSTPASSSQILPLNLPGAIESAESQTDNNRATSGNIEDKPQPVPQRSLSPLFKALGITPAESEKIREREGIPEPTETEDNDISPSQTQKSSSIEGETPAVTPAQYWGALAGKIKAIEAVTAAEAAAKATARLKRKKKKVTRRLSHHRQAKTKGKQQNLQLSSEPEYEDTEIEEEPEVVYQKPTRLVFKKITRKSLSSTFSSRPASPPSEKGTADAQSHIATPLSPQLQSSQDEKEAVEVKCHEAPPPNENETEDMQGQTASVPYGQETAETRSQLSSSSSSSGERMVGIQRYITSPPHEKQSIGKQDQTTLAPVSQYLPPDSGKEATDLEKQSQDAVTPSSLLQPLPPDENEAVDPQSHNSPPLRDKWTEEMQSQNASPPNKEESGPTQNPPLSPLNEIGTAEKQSHNVSLPITQAPNLMPLGEQGALSSSNTETVSPIMQPIMQHQESVGLGENFEDDGNGRGFEDYDYEEDLEGDGNGADFEDYGNGADFEDDTNGEVSKGDNDGEGSHSEDTESTDEDERRWRHLERDYSVGVFHPRYPGRRSRGSLPPPKKSREKDAFDIEL